MMPFLIVSISVIVLLILIIKLRLPAFIALIIVAIGTGYVQGMNFESILKSIQNGTGSTLGYLALVLGLGSMLGGLLAESGAALQITRKLSSTFGSKKIEWSMVIAGFIIGIPMFYTVGFVLMVPIIFALAKSTKTPVLLIAIPTVASLSVTHGFLPPHPAPTALAVIFDANMGKTFLLGLVIAIPTVIVAGPLFAKSLKRIKANIPKDLFQIHETNNNTPSFNIALFTAILPVVLIGVSAVLKIILPENSQLIILVDFFGEPIIALLVALLVGIYTLGINCQHSLTDISTILANSAKGIAMILLIIGAGGAFKQILIDSGMSVEITESLQGLGASPIIITWGVAAALRIALGSATVAALTAAGIAQPLVASTGVSAELLVLAAGAGSLTLSQVNDTGFWLFKEYFGLSIVDTFKSWTAMETIVSVCGLIGCLLMNIILSN